MYQEVFQDDKYNPKLLKDLNSYLNDWLKNISVQERDLVKVNDINYENVDLGITEDVEVEEDTELDELEEVDIVEDVDVNNEEIQEKSEFLGAIRLPDNTFDKNANTNVVSDIIFLQKRENPIEITEECLENPDMILGNVGVTSSQHGMKMTY